MARRKFGKLGAAVAFGVAAYALRGRRGAPAGAPPGTHPDATPQTNDDGSVTWLAPMQIRGSSPAAPPAGTPAAAPAGHSAATPAAHATTPAHVDEHTPAGAAQALAAYYNPPRSGRDRTRIAQLQRTLGVSPADGSVGPDTTNAAERYGVVIESAPGGGLATGPAVHGEAGAAHAPAHAPAHGGAPPGPSPANQAKIASARTSAAGARTAATRAKQLARQAKVAAGAGDKTRARALASQARAAAHTARGHASRVRSLKPSREHHAAHPPAHGAHPPAHGPHAPARGPHPSAAHRRPGVHGDDDASDTSSAPDDSSSPDGASSSPDSIDWRSIIQPMIDDYSGTYQINLTPSGLPDHTSGRFNAADAAKGASSIRAYYSVDLHHAQLQAQSDADASSAESAATDADSSAGTDTTQQPPPADVPQPDTSSPSDGGGGGGGGGGATYSGPDPFAATDAPPSGGGGDGGSTDPFADVSGHSLAQAGRTSASQAEHNIVARIQRDLVRLGILPEGSYTLGAIDDATANSVERLLGPVNTRSTRWLPWSAYLDTSAPVTTQALRRSLAAIEARMPNHSVADFSRLTGVERDALATALRDLPLADILIAAVLAIVESEYQRRFGAPRFAEMFSSRPHDASPEDA